MKSLTVPAIIAAFGAAIIAAPAAACTTYVAIDNQSSVDLNVLSCGTRKDGADKWVANFNCFEELLSQDKLKAGDGWNLKLQTTRKDKTSFKVRITYHYGKNGPVKTSESDYSKCIDGHSIVIN